MHNIRKIISSQLSVIKKTLARCVDQRFQSNVKVVIKRLNHFTIDIYIKTVARALGCRDYLINCGNEEI